MIPVIIAGIALIGAGAWIYSELQEQSGVERQRWETKHEEVTQSIDWHERQIRTHLHSAQQSFDFKTLVDMHFSCVKVADQAYSLLRDARLSIEKIGIAIGKTKEQLNLLFTQKKSTQVIAEKNEIQQEIQSLLDLRSKLFADLDQLKQQRDSFLGRVQELNSNTHALKLRIRDKTGQKGLDWFNRLEARKQQRNQF